MFSVVCCGVVDLVRPQLRGVARANVAGCHVQQLHHAPLIANFSKELALTLTSAKIACGYILVIFVGNNKNLFICCHRLW